MAHILFFEKPGCGGNARQRASLVAAGHTLEIRDLSNWPWTADELRGFLQALPLADWFNPSAPDIRSGRIRPEDFDERKALDLLVARPLLVRRPLMQVGDRRMAGFDVERVHAWVGLEAATLTRGPSLQACVRGSDKTLEQGRRDATA